ncbi:carbohydrate ABC transporter permease [Opitutus terrae]|uniref:Binding-protein-dependent transport systems inner membrane component n=1 Tax=Opitutus terrae (strain DSM 11246 / JCM 15787 / PB90-1) TaxID=452637 RepID=B1ZVU8_OPITP|nr:carbohydrate ABC transporter permease [Opitutus terrae]ACB75034.1 binding-protein-dependent transport systems inner membrane component [Opitutus terrae PB90-1]
MKPHGPVSRTFIYLMLIVASGLFLTPFVWLVSTSLKPVEQTMVLPPTFLPRAHYVEIDGRRMEVVIDYTMNQPGVVADVVSGPDAGKRVFLLPDQAIARAAELNGAHRVAAGWTHVTERLEQGAGRERQPRWDIVPPGAVQSEIKFRWSNYPNALASMGGGAAAGSGNVSFWVFLSNTLIVCVLGVIGTVLSNAIVAYGFARLRWRGRDAFFALTLATLMVPFPVLMVPLYGVFRELGWIGTLMPLWVPAFFGSAFNIFLMRQFFLTIPEELSEAARIDGSSEWRIFWRIILPLSKPVLAVAALFHFLYAWNDFMGPFLYLTRKETFTLSIALQNYQSQTGGVQWHYLMAASTVTVLPIIVLFFFAQRTFIQGIATTGSKG